MSSYDNSIQEVSKTVFPANTETIYGIVYVEAQQPVPLKVRWSYVNKNIIFYEDIRRIETRGEWFLSPPEGSNFTPGTYRFEVLLVDEPVEVVNFEIK